MPLRCHVHSLKNDKNQLQGHVLVQFLEKSVTAYLLLVHLIHSDTQANTLSLTATVVPLLVDRL